MFCLVSLKLLINVILHPDRESKVPAPPAGHRWKEVRHDNTVTWLASWTENIQGAIKYVMLNANSKLKVKTYPQTHPVINLAIYK